MRKNAGLGIGYDGDGDRIGVVDETGSIIYGDQLMIIFAREILSRKPGATFISEVKCSQTMYDDIEKHGGRAIMWKTGHSLIKEKMKEEKAELAGEMSGHMFFADRYLGYDDATYASCRLLEILAAAGQDTVRLLADVPKTFTTPEIRVDCPDDRKFEWSPGSRRSSEKTTRSSTSTACGCCSTTAGAWCGPPTPSRPWCCDSRRSPRRGWPRYGNWWNER